MTKLLTIEEIVEKRIAAGIAKAAELELFYKGEFDDEDYDDDYKQQLLDELERAKHETVVQTAFVVVFQSGVPIPALRDLGPRLKAFAEKQTGYPVTVLVHRSGILGHLADGNQAAASAANAARTAAGVWWPWRSMSHWRL